MFINFGFRSFWDWFRIGFGTVRFCQTGPMISVLLLFFFSRLVFDRVGLSHLLGLVFVAFFRDQSLSQLSTADYFYKTYNLKTNYARSLIYIGIRNPTRYWWDLKHWTHKKRTFVIFGTRMMGCWIFLYYHNYKTINRIKQLF